MRTTRLFPASWGGLIQLSLVVCFAELLLFAAFERQALAVDKLLFVKLGFFSVMLALMFYRVAMKPATVDYKQLDGTRAGRWLMVASLIALVALCIGSLLAGASGLPLFDMATLYLICGLVALEGAVLQQGYCQQAKPAENQFKKMRPAIFLFLFGIDLSMAFIPLHMENLPQSLQGISPDILMGLPISVEFLCVGIAILLSGAWLDRSGWKPPFYCGLAITGLGATYSWLAPDAVQFIISRGVLGFGYGLTLLASQGYVIRHTGSENRSRGLAHLFAGLYSGSICGAATGAVLAEIFGYGPVFLIGAILIFSVIVYGLWVLGGDEPTVVAGAPEPNRESAEKSAKNSLIEFLTDRRVLAATLFSSMPASIAVVGFVNYFSPVYLNRAGVNDAAIGQILMLFGVVLALFGPALGAYADRSKSKRWPILFGCILGGAAFLVFSFSQGVIAVTLAVLLLGISNCLVLPAQSAYVLNQPVTQRLGDGKAMGIFRSSSRVGQMLGPVFFALVISAADIEYGVIIFGVCYLLTALLFWLMTSDRQAALAPGVSSYD